MRREVTMILFDAKKHWNLLEVWWKERGFIAPPLELLPPTGVIARVDGQFVCAGFLTKTDAGAAVLGHFVSDPEATSEHRHEALDAVISFLVQTAKFDNFKYAFMSTNLPNLETRYLAHNFIKTDEKINVYGRSLCHGD